MTATDWLASADPIRMLQSVMPYTSDDGLRAFACACCRRIWDKYPFDWADKVFAASNPQSHGGYVSPDDWKDARPRRALEMAELFCVRQATLADLQQSHADAASFAEYVKDRFGWANYRLGDSASGEEYDVGYVAMFAAAAARDASNPDIRNSVLNSVKNSAESIGHDPSGMGRTALVDDEKRCQADLARRMLTFAEQPP